MFTKDRSYAEAEEEYVRVNGQQCPYCGDRIEGSEVTIDGGYASQEVWCLSCCKQWTDMYKLIGFNPTEG